VFSTLFFALTADEVADKGKVRHVRRIAIAMARIFVGRIRSALRFLLGFEMVLVSCCGLWWGICRFLLERGGLLIGSTFLFSSLAGRSASLVLYLRPQTQVCPSSGETLLSLPMRLRDRTIKAG